MHIIHSFLKNCHTFPSLDAVLAAVGAPVFCREEWTLGASKLAEYRAYCLYGETLAVSVGPCEVGKFILADVNK